MSVADENEALVNELRAKLGEPETYSFHIPNWAPVEAKEGLWWMRSQLGEGFYVTYRIDPSLRQVFFKYWEFEEDEPEWEDEEYLS
jgi:hypothetical protein